MKVLVTAFDPFGGETINPALEAVSLLPNKIAGADVIKLTVPTVFVKSASIVAEAMAQHHPDAVLCIGQAGGRTAITPERIAINVDDARMADNEGNQPVDKPIISGGPNAYFATLPIKAVVQAIAEEDLPAAVSNTAGTFVCNHLMYHVLHLAEEKYRYMLCGFIHVPYLTEQAQRQNLPCFGMELKDIVRGLIAAITAVVKAFPAQKS